MSENSQQLILDEILISLKNGDNHAMDALYEKTNKRLLAICYGYLRSLPKAEDALHDSYVKIFENVNTFKGKNGYNWVYTICKNVCLNYIKKQKREVATDLDVEENAYLFTDYIDAPTLKDESGILKIAEKVLNFQEYQIVFLHAVSGFKFKEIAKILNRFESSVRWSYNNALTKIRKEYERGEK